MSKALSVAVIAVLAGALFVLPGPDQPRPGDAPAHNPSAFAVCPIIEGGGRSTEVAAASTVEGPTGLTLFANGVTAGSIQVVLGANGSTVVPVVDVAAVGTVGGLVEFPAATAAAASRTQGAVSSTLEACVGAIPAQVFIAGGSTLTRGEFTLHLMNPFAGDAVASLTVHSEAGPETNSRFERVIVPSRGSTVLALNDIIPGREWVTVRIDVTQGRIAASARQSQGEAAASWNAVEPASSWLLPLPSEGEGRLVIASASPGDLDYQIDLYSTDGVEGAAITGQLSEGGQESIALPDLEGVRAVRVVASNPIVASLEIGDGTVLAATTAAPEAAGSWLLPAALDTPARVILLNPELEDAQVVVTALRSGGGEFQVTVPAEGVLEVSLDGADAYLVDSGVPVVALLYAAGDSADALAMGVPLSDG